MFSSKDNDFYSKYHAIKSIDSLFDVLLRRTRRNFIFKHWRVIYRGILHVFLFKSLLIYTYYRS